MKLKKQQILAIISIIFVLGGLKFVYDHMMYIETENAQIEAPTVMLASKISGYISEVKVVEGQRVKKGDLLVQIDHRDYRSAVDGVKSDLLSLEVRKSDAEKSYRRTKELLSQGAVSSQQYDTAAANFNAAKASYDSMAARMSQAQLNLEYTLIKAPADGSIAKKSAEVGQLASPGVPLIGFVSSESRWVTANFKETEIESIQVGKKAEIRIDAISGKTFPGEVESISSATGSTFTLLPPDNATGNFTKVVQRIPVKIKILGLTEKDIDQIQAGLSVVVKIHSR